MSRIGKQEIVIPAGVEVTQNGVVLTVKGPKGSLSKIFRSEVDVKIANGIVSLSIKRNDKFSKSLWGTMLHM